MKTRVLMLMAILAAGAAWADAGSFDRKAWREDYAALKRELEHSYSHLAWAASPASGVDLPSLDRRTRAALEEARTDADGAATLVSFVAAFHDGHFAPTTTPEPNGAGPEPPPRAADSDASAGCAAAGYSPATRIAFSLPFESLHGFRMDSDGISHAFRSGIIVAGERRFGLLRIPRFRPAEYPTLCAAAWPALQKIDAVWLQELAEHLTAFRVAHVAAVIVDIGGNGGGNDVGEWAPRLFTAREVHSAPLLMHTGALGAKYMDEQLQGLNDAVAAHPDQEKLMLAVMHRPLLKFNQRKNQSLQPSCDMSWVWREQRSFDPKKCSGLVDAGFASGATDYLAPGNLPPDVAAALYWPSIADPMRGAWDGPVYVLTDSGTASAAEMFAALMQDNKIARTVGVRTLGLGCGSMVESAPFTLPHSRLSFRIPNCVRLRADGSDEVAGIKPDLQVLPTANESPRARAARALAVIDRDLPR